MQNIGKGVAFGLGHLSDSRKESAIEEARINQSQGIALRAKNEMTYQKDVLAQRERYQNELIEIRKLQEKDNKSKAEDALLEKKQNHASQAEARLEKAMTSWGSEFMRPYTLKAQMKSKEASDLRKNAITPEDQQRAQDAENDAMSIIDQGQSLMTQHPIYRQSWNTLYPNLPLPSVQSTPQPKTTAKVDTSKFKPLNF
jgi:hypothetical protein